MGGWPRFAAKQVGPCRCRASKTLRPLHCDGRRCKLSLTAMCGHMQIPPCSEKRNARCRGRHAVSPDALSAECADCGVSLDAHQPAVAGARHGQRGQIWLPGQRLLGTVIYSGMSQCQRCGSLGMPRPGSSSVTRSARPQRSQGPYTSAGLVGAMHVCSVVQGSICLRTKPENKSSSLPYAPHTPSLHRSRLLLPFCGPLLSPQRVLLRQTCCALPCQHTPISSSLSSTCSEVLYLFPVAKLCKPCRGLT
jgi:hypothetical protein